MLNRPPIRFVFAGTLPLAMILGLCALVSVAQAQSKTASEGKTASAEDRGLDVHTIVARMTAAQQDNHDRIRAYTVIRQYTLKSGNHDNSDSKVVAEVSYVPPSKKDYEIREASGSGRGESVIRRVLDHETQMSSTWSTTAVTEANYSFALAGREQSKDCNCYVLAVTPRRDSKDLIKGKVFVDPDNFLIRRMEGELSKSPSWWVKHVNVTLYFNQVSGMWLQTAAYADAEVRLFGRHVLESHDLDYRTSDVVASDRPSRRDSSVARTGARNNGTLRGRNSAIPILGSTVVMGPR